MNTLGHFSIISRRTAPRWSLVPRRVLGLALVDSGLAATAHGDDLPAPATLDIPIPLNRAMPLWVGQPQTPPATFATMNLPIMTPDPAASLLVTVSFQEKDGGFLRIIWTGPNGAQVLSNNFYENIGMANQRSLLVDASTLGGDGTLTFQSGDSAPGIQRIKLEWLENKPALAPSSVTDPLVTASNGQTQSQENLNGQPAAAQPAAWQNQLVTVPLTDSPVRIEDGVEFSLDLDSVPTTARVALKETGLPFGKHFILWVNQQFAGTITPAVPDLTDSGFFAADPAKGTPANYVGWRDGSFFIPVTLLKSGVNTLQFDTENEAQGPALVPTAAGSGTNSPLALKGLTVQLDYQSPAQEPAAPAPPQFLLGPVTPLAPASLSTTSTNPTP